MNLKAGACISLALVTLASFTACNDDNVAGVQQSAEEPFDYTIIPADQTELIVEAITGSVTIIGASSGSAVHVQGRRIVKAPTRSQAQARLADLEVSVTEGEDAITVITVQPAQSSGINYEVRYTITLPGEMNLEISHVTGEVVIRRTRGDTRVRNVTGMIGLDDVEAASVDVELVTGSVEGFVTLPRAGRVRMGVASGSIALSIPRETSAVLRSSVGTGTLAFVGLDIVDTDPRENVVLCTLGEGEGEIDLWAATGTVGVTGRW